MENKRFIHKIKYEKGTDENSVRVSVITIG